MRSNASPPTWLRRPEPPDAPVPAASSGAAHPRFDPGPRPITLNDRSTTAFWIRSPAWKAERSPGLNTPSAERATTPKVSTARRGEARLAICSTPSRDMAQEKLATDRVNSRMIASPCDSAQMLPQRLPIVRVPAAFEVLALALRKARMVEDQPRPGALRLELELRDRIDARLPVADAPGLDDPLIGHQLDVAPLDHPAEAGEGAADLRIDLGRGSAAELAELAGIGERFVDALGAGIENDFLMDGLGHGNAPLVGGKFQVSSAALLEPVCRLFWLQAHGSRATDSQHSSLFPGVHYSLRERGAARLTNRESGYWWRLPRRIRGVPAWRRERAGAGRSRGRNRSRRSAPRPAGTARS